MASAFETTATAIKTVIDTEFAPEGFVAIFDNLHESLGRNSRAVGISPVEDVVDVRSNVTQVTWLEVKFYDTWIDEIQPTTQVDPRVITGYAERFRAALRDSFSTDPHTGETWFFSLVRVSYPNDPTGNKSRFVAQIKALGNNAALVETVA